MANNFSNPIFVILCNLVYSTVGAPLYEREDDRSSTWQVLADGTQDLAALVGLFATDSVERYSVDYSRGYLGAAMAPASMLGILGYVRALVKITMGSDACVSAAFPTAPVRALLGVPKEDRLPGEELVTVTYIKRYIEGENIVWKRIKSVAHTKESMPVTWAHTAVGRDRDPQLLLLEAGRKTKRLFSRQRPPYRWEVIVAILLATGINSFAVFLVGGGWTWSKYVASIITFSFLASSSLMWAYVYVQEQVPLFSDESTLWLDTKGEIHDRPCGRVSLRADRKDASFAFLENAGSYVLLPCSTPTYARSMFLRVFSGISAMLITLGYICQYIVVRRSTRSESLRWLLIQGALTLVRLVVWVFPSRLIPRFFDQKAVVYGHLPRPSLSDFQASSGTLFGSKFSDYPTFTELELAVTFSSAGIGLDEFSVPQDVLLALLKVDLADTFRSILQSESDWVERVKKALSGTANRWEIPPLLFRKLLLQRIADVELANIEFSDELLVGDWTCLLLDVAGEQSWQNSTPVLVPLVQLTYRIDKLNDKGSQAERPEVMTGFCTCLSPDNPSTNLVQVASLEGSIWVPFDEIRPAPANFLWGKFSHFRVVLETGEAGDASIDSELTVDGYTKRCPSFRRKLEEAESLQKISKRDGLERSIIEFFRESRLLDKTLRPELAQMKSSPGPRAPEFSRIGKNGDVLMQIPRGGQLSGSSGADVSENLTDEQGDSRNMAQAALPPEN